MCVHIQKITKSHEYNTSVCNFSAEKKNRTEFTAELSMYSRVEHICGIMLWK